MSEEIRNSGMEINEAALEGVSGGYGGGELELAIKNVCSACANGINSGYFRCTGGASELRRYLEEHGVNSVRFPRDCPFRKNA